MHQLEKCRNKLRYSGSQRTTTPRQNARKMKPMENILNLVNVLMHFRASSGSGTPRIRPLCVLYIIYILICPLYKRARASVHHSGMYCIYTSYRYTTSCTMHRTSLFSIVLAILYIYIYIRSNETTTDHTYTCTAFRLRIAPSKNGNSSDNIIG